MATFDACPLSLRLRKALDLRQIPGQMGQLGARGVLFHRFAAAAINWMKGHGRDGHPEREIGVDVAMELLTRIIAQRDAPTPDGDWESCPPEDVVSVRLQDLRWLRVLVTRWAYKNRFDIDRVVEVERRLSADIEVVGPGGERYLRTITGKPDLLLAGPHPDEATILDWKSGFANPPKRRPEVVDEATGEVIRDATGDKLSDMGYVQQVVYGWLVMKNFPVIQRVTEREYYVMAKEDPVREATVERWEMERIEDVLAAVVSQMDAAVDADPELLRQQAAVRDSNAQARKYNERVEAAARKAGRPVTASELRPLEPTPYGRWFPIPGTHCGTCLGRRYCPVREYFGVPDTLEEAQQLAREWHVAGEIRKERTPFLKDYIDENGPIPIAHAKGRRVVGYKDGSRSLSLFEPDDAPESPLDPVASLEEAARQAGVLVEEDHA